MPRVLREALFPVMLNREHWTIYWSEKMNGAAFILWDIIECWELGTGADFASRYDVILTALNQSH